MPPKRVRSKVSLPKSNLNPSSTTDWLLDFINQSLKEEEAKLLSSNEIIEESTEIRKEAPLQCIPSQEFILDDILLNCDLAINEANNIVIGECIVGGASPKKIAKKGSIDNELQIISAVTVSKSKRKRKEIPSYSIPEGQRKVSLDDLIRTSGFTLNKSSYDGGTKVYNGPANKMFKPEKIVSQGLSARIIASPRDWRPNGQQKVNNQGNVGSKVNFSAKKRLFIRVQKAGAAVPEVVALDDSIDEKKDPRPLVQCNICDELVDDAVKHMFLHCPIEPPYACPRCDELYSAKTDAVNHLREVHKSEIKPFYRGNKLRMALWRMWSYKCFPDSARPSVPSTSRCVSCNSCAAIIQMDTCANFDHIINEHSNENLNYNDSEGEWKRFFS